MNTTVEMLPAHQQAEDALRDLTARRKELQSMLAGPGSWRISDALKRTARDLTAVDDEIAHTREALLPMRAKHAEAVRDFYREPIRDAARRALVALDEATLAVEEINAMRLEIRAAGGEGSNVPAEKLLIPLRQLLRPLAGGDK